MQNSSNRAVILLSGGLDSATCLAIAKSQGFVPYAISFRYGQRHRIELERAASVARHLGAADHIIIDIDLAKLGGSALTDRNIAVPKHQSVDQIGSEIPLTYVPARNTVFLSYALAWAEVLESKDIFIGVNALDYSGYPDCRPEYISAFARMANLATKRGVEGNQLTIHAPLIQLTKAQIIERGLGLGVDYGLTISCYDPAEDGTPCGRCDSCLLRAKGFSELGSIDPALK
ncbi:MAG: 7-cyano-7-deazaguanine synthase QueC [Pirellula sp.]|jgi:7-cyano-7-deazaguanine synthase|nr:7-cyano-7-deazaguanine synthase QueC [Pirellula sp.]